MSKQTLGPRYHRLWIATVSSNLGDGVSLVGYPWLASAVTRSPVLIALVAVVQRLPWLVFTLPAGVITDRVDRRRLMVSMDCARAAVTFGVALAVLVGGSELPAPNELRGHVGATRTGLYVALLVATLLLGIAEVLRDNAAQTILPTIVAADGLERANGRMYSAELVANTLIGPPLGSLLVGLAFFLPFAADGVSFAVAAALVATITGDFRASSAPTTAADGRPTARKAWHHDLREGVRWLWAHPLLRPMAIVLGCMNALGMFGAGTFVLFAQEVLHTSTFTFALLSTGGALGGVLGGLLADRVTKRIGPGASLRLTLVTGAVTSTLTGLLSHWPLVWLVTSVTMFTGILWNVITVALRQSIIPDHLLGRVNSVYRFFAWGMIPVGTFVGGLIVSIADGPLSRTWALRLPWLVAGALSVVLFAFGAPKLTTARIEAARDGATRAPLTATPEQEAPA